MIKVVIFDLDGTLLDTLTDLYESANFTLATFSLPPRTIAEVRQFVGNGIKNLINRCLPPDRRNLLDAALPVFLAHYEKNCENNTAPYNGIVELLAALKNKGLKIAVASNKKDEAVRALCGKFFPGLIDFAIGERNGLAIKPIPDMINIIFQKLNVKAPDCVYVGDSDVDLLTAKNSYLSCISVTWGFKDKDFLIFHGAKVLADTPAQVLTAINNI